MYEFPCLAFCLTRIRRLAKTHMAGLSLFCKRRDMTATEAAPKPYDGPPIVQLYKRASSLKIRLSGPPQCFTRKHLKFC